MTFSVRVSIVLVFGITVFVTSGSALRCWVCSSNVNAMCSDPMNTTDHQATFHVKNCQMNQYGPTKSICRKIVKREFGERVVIRQCSSPYHDEVNVVDGPCSSSQSTGRDIIESCHICSSDLCNSATSASKTTLLLYASAMTLFAYTFYQSKYPLH